MLTIPKGNFLLFAISIAVASLNLGFILAGCGVYAQLASQLFVKVVKFNKSQLHNCDNPVRVS